MGYGVGDREVKYFGAAKASTFPIPYDLQIPYTFSVGPVVFIGVLYYNTDDPKESFSEGTITRLTIPSNYHIDKKHTGVWGCIGLSKGGLIVDIENHKMFVQECHYVMEQLRQQWKCSDRKLVLEW